MQQGEFGNSFRAHSGEPGEGDGRDCYTGSVSASAPTPVPPPSRYQERSWDLGANRRVFDRLRTQRIPAQGRELNGQSSARDSSLDAGISFEGGEWPTAHDTGPLEDEIGPERTAAWNTLLLYLSDDLIQTGGGSDTNTYLAVPPLPMPEFWHVLRVGHGVLEFLQPKEHARWMRKEQPGKGEWRLRVRSWWGREIVDHQPAPRGTAGQRVQGVLASRGRWEVPPQGGRKSDFSGTPEELWGYLERGRYGEQIPDAENRLGSLSAVLQAADALMAYAAAVQRSTLSVERSAPTGPSPAAISRSGGAPMARSATITMVCGAPVARSAPMVRSAPIARSAPMSRSTPMFRSAPIVCSAIMACRAPMVGSSIVGSAPTARSTATTTATITATAALTPAPIPTPTPEQMPWPGMSWPSSYYAADRNTSTIGRSSSLSSSSTTIVTGTARTPPHMLALTLWTDLPWPSTPWPSNNRAGDHGHPPPNDHHLLLVPLLFPPLPPLYQH